MTSARDFARGVNPDHPHYCPPTPPARLPLRVTARGLRLADTVDLGFAPWGSAIVQQIKDGTVTMFRPYGTTADFSCTSGVICYTGIENCEVSLESSREYLVVERKELK
jgi:hypothetical protein